MFAAFTQSLALVLTPMGLLSILGGVLCGIFVGVMPGLSSVMGMSIMLPVALSLNGNLGVLMMLGIFCGAIYGGSITAIMINTPGTANSAATCLDGYPMAHKYHQPGRALSISTTASTFGGLFSAVMLLWTSPILSSFALKFSAQESFALALFGISVVASVSSENVLKGVMGALIGLLLATVGVDVTTGAYRFTFDTVYLTGGISNIPVLIGLFAFSQGLINVQESFGTTRAKVNTKLERVLPSKSDLVAIFPTLIRSSLIGTLIGAIPGTGGDIASWVGYNEAKRWSKHPEQFGDGAPDGIAAPESANNAISGGALIPLLSLGIPGDGVTAMLLGAFMIHGLTPGPLLFVESADLIYTIFIACILANVVMLVLELGGMRIFVRLLSIPKYILLPVVLVLCTVGAFATNNRIFDAQSIVIFGVLGYLMSKFKIPVAPFILSFILCDLLETNLRRGLMLTQNDFLAFFTHPIAAVFMVAAVLFVVWTVIKQVRNRKKETAGAA